MKQQAEEKIKAEEVRKQQLVQEKRATQERKRLEEIKRHVKLHWTRPENTINDLQVTLDVRLLPSGDVEKVIIIESSDNIIFDRSAELAVYKASPLPMPMDPKVASQFLKFNFIFNP